MPKSTRVLLIWLGVAGLALIALGFAPFALLRGALDRLAADGSLDLFSPALGSLLQLPLRLAGAALLAASAAGLLRPDWVARTLAALRAFPGLLAADARALFRRLAGLRLTAWEGAGLAATLLLGLYARLVLLRAPMQYDEAYTVAVFAARGVWASLTDYHLPNNHIFHTLLVRLAMQLFGDAPWAVRIPAFLAGWGLILAVYLAGRALFSRRAGLLAAMLVAVWPFLVGYSINARGYSLLAFFTLLLFALAPVLLQGNRFAWLLAALLGGLGLFTVPVMLYALGVWFLWLVFLAWRQRGQAGMPFPALLAALAGCGLGMLLLAGIGYLPALVVSGPALLFGNPFVLPVGVETWQRTFWSAAAGVVNLTALDVPGWLRVLVAAGMLLSVFAGRGGLARRLGHPTLALVLFLGVIIPLQRPDLNPKLFVSLDGLLLLFAADGWCSLWERLLPERSRFAALPLAVSLAGLAFFGIQASLPDLPYLLNGDKGPEEAAVAYIAARYQPGDAVLSLFPHDPKVWYYGSRYGIPSGAYHLKDFDRAWVLASRTMREMLGELGPRSRPMTPEDCVLQETLLDMPIYLCQRTPD